jgi:peptidoglycan L-alanyl-D-glutamate endopeptidase CwlK
VASAVSDDTPRQLATLAEPARSLAVYLVSAAREAGWPVVIAPLGALRTLEDQRRLYARGRTAPGPIVTHTLTSRHLSGLAFDLDLLGYPRSAGMPLWRHFGNWWKSQGYRWGGDWGDYGHFEVR